MKKFITKNEIETKKIGKELGKNLVSGDIIALMGELGAGKTVLVKGIAQSLGIPAQLINSPSFVLIREYPAKINLYHFDLYRLKNLNEIETLGWEEYLSKKGILIIEWAERMRDILPEEYLCVKMKILDTREREIKLIPHGERYRKLLNKLNPKFAKKSR
ncbi:MAG: tRNA (adenosine(37)-N6)-threonylcarbamoyltransferase complex ATPase subunit type 1 TsaE [Candidatus Omnitrophota bacterium]